MTSDGVRVLGVDTSLRCTGVGVVEMTGNGGMRSLYHGCLKTEKRWRHSDCLRLISEGIRKCLQDFCPTSVAIEGAFYCKNVKTAMVLGEARGVAIAVCAEAGLPVFEYAPRRVKQALTGVGGADKSQVMQMVMRLLGVKEKLQEDAADALALAICHMNSSRGLHQQEPL